MLNLRRARHEARPPGILRLLESAFDATCGYGYRPVRMVPGIALALAMFSLAVWLCGPAGCGPSLQGCLMDFVNPLSFGDFGADFGSAAQVLLIIESCFGTVSIVIFFALLVRY